MTECVAHDWEPWKHRDANAEAGAEARSTTPGLSGAAHNPLQGAAPVPGCCGPGTLVGCSEGFR